MKQETDDLVRAETEVASDVAPETDLATVHALRRRDEAGLTTAELLANAALGVAALAVIWVALQAVGVDIVNEIRDALL